jgi:TRAP-type uncharacterized transport system substrate-binding protein
MQKLTDLIGKRIGIFYPSMCADYIIPQRIFQYFSGSDSNNRYFTFDYGNTVDHIEKLKMGQIDAFFFTSYFPNKMLDNIFNQIHSNDFTMIPIVFDNPEKFQLENPYLEKGSIDLNFVKQFLPKVVGETYFNQFNPDFPTYKSKTFIVCNKKMDTPTTYNLIRLLANQPIEYSNIFKYLTNIRTIFINSSLLPIPYHPGVEKYLRESGYINRVDNLECAYFVGKKECTDKVLRKNALFQWDFLSTKDQVPRGQLPDVEEAWNLPSQTPFIR